MIKVLLLFIQLCFADVVATESRSSGVVGQQELQTKINDLNAEIERLRQENLSCTSTKDCFSLELGSKSCGGPESYLVLSKKNKSIQLIKDKAKEYLELKKAYKTQSGGMFSNCMFVGPSEVGCINKKCQEIPQ